MFGSDYAEGSDESLAELARRCAGDREAADREGLAVGDRFQVTATGGQKLDLKVAAVSKPDKFNLLGLGDVTIARQAFDSAFAEDERYGFKRR